MKLYVHCMHFVFCGHSTLMYHAFGVVLSCFSFHCAHGHATQTRHTSNHVTQHLNNPSLPDEEFERQHQQLLYMIDCHPW